MVGRRRGRGRGGTASGGDRRSSRPIRTSTPRNTRIQDDSDSEMPDAEPAEDNTSLPNDDSAAATPVADEEEEEEEDATSPKQEEDEDPEPSSPVVQVIPRKRRGPGRPPRNPRPDFDTPRADDDASDSGTPRRGRRGPGRPPTSGRGGFRGRAKWQKKLEPDRVPIDKAGNTVMVLNDEADLPEDDDGETKVDRDGKLLGGREYRVRVFTITGRENRLYMLSTEPARCTGFRDSYLFFNKHLSLHKIVLNEDEKMDLIEREVIPHSYKGRNIGVCTARSVFREFGARIVIGGKKVTDDYYESAARERGDVEGELADPNDRLPQDGEPYNKNQYVAWHGASQVYHTQPTSNTLPTSKQIPGKRKLNVTVGNWQLEHARDASKFNSTLALSRRATLDGIYDTHTNLVLIPKIMQPTHAKWSVVVQEDPKHPKGSKAPNAPSSSSSASSSLPPSSSSFPPIPPSQSSSHLTVDTLFLPPRHLGMGLPGPDGDVLDIGPNGLAGVSDAVRDELPASCRGEFDAALEREREWKGTWGGEIRDGMRGPLRVGYAGFPV